MPFLVCGLNEQSPFELIKLSVSSQLILVATVFFLLSNLNHEGISIRYTRANILIGIILLVTFLSYFFSNSKFDSFWGNYNIPSDGLLSFVVYFLFCLIVVQVLSDKKDIQKINLVLILVAFFMASYGVVQHFGLDPVDWWGYSQMHLNAYGTIGQSVGYASILGALLPLVLVYFLKQDKPIRAYIIGLIFFIVLLGLMYSGSRVPTVLSLAMSICIVTFYFIKNGKKKLQKTALVFFFIAATQVLYYSEQNTALTHKFKPHVVSRGLEERIQVWEDAFKIWQKYPILGSGPETFGVELKLVNTKEFNTNANWGLYWNKAHNHLIHYLVTIGILGLAAHLIFFAFVFYEFSKFIFIKKIDDIDLLRLAYFSGYFFIFIANLTAFNFVVTQLYQLLFPALYFLTFEERIKTFSFNSPKFVNRINIILLCTLCGLLSYEVYKFWNADRYFTMSRLVFERDKNLKTAIENIDKAIAIKPNDCRYYFRKATYFLTAYKFQVQQTGTLNSSAAESELNELTQKGIDCSMGKSAEYWFYRGRLFSDMYMSRLISSYSIAEQSFIEGSKFSPANPVFHYQLGLIYIVAGRAQDFVKKMNDVIDLKKDYFHAYSRLLTFYYENKDVTGVYQTVEKIKKIEFISGEFLADVKTTAELAGSYKDFTTRAELMKIHQKFTEIAAMM